MSDEREERRSIIHHSAFIIPRSSSSSGRPLDMSAELVAHRRQHLFGKGVLLAGAETGVEGSRENIGWNRFFQRGYNRPAAFAGVLHGAGVVRERWRFRERHGRQVEQPGSDDAASSPHLSNVGEVEVVALVGG